MHGPFPPDGLLGLHINRMGVVLTGHVPGRWRLITNLSYLEGASVNDGIWPNLCSLRYISVEIMLQLPSVWVSEPYWISNQLTTWCQFTRRTTCS